MYSFFVSILRKMGKEEKKEKEGQEKRTNAILGPSSRLFKEFSERLVEAERKGVFTGQEEERAQKVESGPCPHCVRKGHEEPMCKFCYESVRAWWSKPKQRWKAKQENKGPASEQRPPTSTKAGPSKGKVSMVCVNDQTTVHSPVWINGVKFTRCLIDSGPEVSLTSVKDAIRHGFMHELGGVKEISGFNL